MVLSQRWDPREVPKPEVTVGIEPGLTKEVTVIRRLGLSTSKQPPQPFENPIALPVVRPSTCLPAEPEGVSGGALGRPVIASHGSVDAMSGKKQMPCETIPQYMDHHPGTLRPGRLLALEPTAGGRGKLARQTINPACMNKKGR
jgi:hypothetical protein